jgi:hypothetical protein
MALLCTEAVIASAAAGACGRFAPNAISRSDNPVLAGTTGMTSHLAGIEVATSRPHDTMRADFDTLTADTRRCVLLADLQA